MPSGVSVVGRLIFFYQVTDGLANSWPGRRTQYDDKTPRHPPPYAKIVDKTLDNRTLGNQALTRATMAGRESPADFLEYLP